MMEQVHKYYLMMKLLLVTVVKNDRGQLPLLAEGIFHEREQAVIKMVFMEDIYEV